MSFDAIVVALVATAFGGVMAILVLAVFGLLGEGLVEGTDMPQRLAELPLLGAIVVTICCLVAPTLLVWPVEDMSAVKRAVAPVGGAVLLYLVSFSLGYGVWSVVHDRGEPGRARRARAPAVAISRSRRFALVAVWLPAVCILPIAVFVAILVVYRP